MSQRIPIGRMRPEERNRDEAPVPFAPIEFDRGSAILTSAPGCAHLFEISELEDDYEIVDVVDFVEPG